MSDTRPLVELKTEEGDIVMRVFTDRAPVSSANFLAYVDGGHLDGQTVFRIVTLDNEEPRRAHSIEALHWGWLPSEAQPQQPFPNIAHEPTSVTGLTHRRGTLSMARYEPGNSGPSFFFCMRDDPEFDEGGKRQPDGAGFSAFGEVVSGYETMERLFARAEGQPWLRQRIPIYSARRL
jgi:peptidyl-prolyl cis-trans isomerase A (cyclophilin A)